MDSHGAEPRWNDVWCIDTFFRNLDPETQQKQTQWIDSNHPMIETMVFLWIQLRDKRHNSAITPPKRSAKPAENRFLLEDEFPL